jgi:hypothetical protein
MLRDAGERQRAMHRHARRWQWWWHALTVIALAGASLMAFRTLHGALAKASSVEAAPGVMGNPLSGLIRGDDDATALVGRVEQRLLAGSYAYHAVQLERDGSTQWAVTLGKGVPEGTRVSVRSFGRRSEFHSPRLERTFSNLVFGIVSPVEERGSARGRDLD